MKEGQHQRIRDNTGSNRGRREHRQQARPRGSTERVSEGEEAIWMMRTDNDTSDGRGRSQNTTEGQSTLHKEEGGGGKQLPPPLPLPIPLPLSSHTCAPFDGHEDVRGAMSNVLHLVQVSAPYDLSLNTREVMLVGNTH